MYIRLRFVVNSWIMCDCLSSRHAWGRTGGVLGGVSITSANHIWEWAYCMHSEFVHVRIARVRHNIVYVTYWLLYFRSREQRHRLGYK